MPEKPDEPERESSEWSDTGVEPAEGEEVIPPGEYPAPFMNNHFWKITSDIRSLWEWVGEVADWAEAKLGEVDDALQAHVEDTDNPHEVDADDVDAAAAQHASQHEAGGDDEILAMNLADVEQLIEEARADAEKPLSIQVVDERPAEEDRETGMIWMIDAEE